INMDIISIRIPEELKRELKEYNINYNNEVRNYLELLVKKEHIKEELNDINNNRNKMKAKYGIFDDSYKLIRDDRDR
ncbi:type II toxin-antitoxin system VapB family antitoxin, partial [Acidiplasma cupricumulans]